ncbi:hypothetical protein LZ32DRAFT_343704 [Colletotrichum eremochloae]|nr:hypothetical protein LZ32DRAFT_343704 [Colletotrichum eremochloae]
MNVHESARLLGIWNNLDRPAAFCLHLSNRPIQLFQLWSICTRPDKLALHNGPYHCSAIRRSDIISFCCDLTSTAHQPAPLLARPISPVNQHFDRYFRLVRQKNKKTSRQCQARRCSDQIVQGTSRRTSPSTWGSPGMEGRISIDMVGERSYLQCRSVASVAQRTTVREPLMNWFRRILLMSPISRPASYFLCSSPAQNRNRNNPLLSFFVL